jgi:hypothetical protein
MGTKNLMDEWVKLRTFGAGTEDVWREYRHTPCGTVIEVADGHQPTCPKCQPKEPHENA